MLLTETELWNCRPKLLWWWLAVEILGYIQKDIYLGPGSHSRLLLFYCFALYKYTSCHGTSHHASLILIHCFPLQLLFHSLVYLGFLTLPFPSLLLLLPFSLLPRSHLTLPSVPTPSTYVYNMPIQLLYNPVPRHIQLYKRCYPRLCL